jgi:hypothetical protein
MHYKGVRDRPRAAIGQVDLGERFINLEMVA